MMELLKSKVRSPPLFTKAFQSLHNHTVKKKNFHVTWCRKNNENPEGLPSHALTAPREVGWPIVKRAEGPNLICSICVGSGERDSSQLILRQVEESVGV